MRGSMAVPAKSWKMAMGAAPPLLPNQLTPPKNAL